MTTRSEVPETLRETEDFLASFPAGRVFLAKLDAAVAVAEERDRAVQRGNRLAQQVYDLRSLIEKLEWSGTHVGEDEDFEACPWCDEPKDDGKHLRDCRVAAALNPAGES